MSKPKYLELALFLFQLLIVNSCTAGISVDYTALYLDVSASDKMSAIQTRLVKTFQNQDIPKYIVNSEKLYLLIQITWNQNGVVKVHKEIWDAEKIQILITDKKTKLRKYFPNPDEAVGGVSWLKH